jgi:hypothetical protein
LAAPWKPSRVHSFLSSPFPASLSLLSLFLHCLCPVHSCRCCCCHSATTSDISSVLTAWPALLVMKTKSQQEKTTREKPSSGPNVATLGGSTGGCLPSRMACLYSQKAGGVRLFASVTAVLHANKHLCLRQSSQSFMQISDPFVPVTSLLLGQQGSAPRFVLGKHGCQVTWTSLSLSCSECCFPRTRLWCPLQLLDCPQSGHEMSMRAVWPVASEGTAWLTVLCTKLPGTGKSCQLTCSWQF